MYHLNSAKTALLVIPIIALWTTALSLPAVSQTINFVDLNQSSQFFSEGNQKFDEQVKKLVSKGKLPNIKLPKDYYRPESCHQSNFLERQHKLQPVTEAVKSSSNRDE